jgi:hypothetical protein
MQAGADEAFALEQELFRRGYLTHVISSRSDGTVLMELVHHLTAAGLVTICAAGSLYEIERERAQTLIAPSRFFDVDTAAAGTPGKLAEFVLAELTKRSIEPPSR